MDTQDQPETKPDRYSLTATAQYVVALAYIGPYIPSLLQRFEGTLGITPAGRLEFTLQNGKILFSAPIGQMNVKVRPAAGTMIVRITGNRYVLHLINPLDNTSPNNASSSGNPGEQWRQMIERYAAAPADTDPITITDAPRPGPATLRFLLVGTLVMTAAISGVVFLNHHRVNDMLIALSLVATVALPYAIWLAHRVKYVKRVILTHLRPTDVT